MFKQIINSYYSFHLIISEFFIIRSDPNWISILSKRTGSTWIQTGSVSCQKGPDPYGSRLDQYPVKKDRIHMDPNWISILSNRTGST